MKAKGLVWIGTRTRKFDDTVRFVGEMLGLRMEHEEPDFASFPTAPSTRSPRSQNDY